MELQSIWFFIWGLLWAVFFITDGFDFGIGSLYPFIGRNNEEKRIMINVMGPLWDGNEVWLITAGGVTFAAFPLVYAVMFSSLYSALMLILFALILRGVSFEFRNKIDNPLWRRIWDICIFTGSFLPAFLFGVAFANIFQGIPINEHGLYQGNIFTLLNLYGLLGGITFALIFILHGSLWLSFKTKQVIYSRAVYASNLSWYALCFVLIVFLIASKFATSLFNNYISHPVLFVFPLAAILGFIGIKIFIKKEKFFKAWLSSALLIFGTTFFGIIGLYPNLFPSSINNAYSLNAFNSSASPLTLKIMLGVVIVFIPLVIAYQIWAYRLFSSKIDFKDLSEEDAY
jgi:cytochrome d ubiquinol oxidase subunit II